VIKRYTGTKWYTFFKRIIRLFHFKRHGSKGTLGFTTNEISKELGVLPKDDWNILREDFQNWMDRHEGEGRKEMGFLKNFFKQQKTHNGISDV
jgi:hypothetical protein